MMSLCYGIQPLQLPRPPLPLQPFAADGLSGLPQPGSHALHVTETDPAKGRGKKQHGRHHIMFSHHPTGTIDPNGTPPLGHGPPFRVPWRRPLLSLLAPAPWRKMEIVLLKDQGLTALPADNQTWLAGKLAIQFDDCPS